jgi:hypothetical protein
MTHSARSSRVLSTSTTLLSGGGDRHHAPPIAPAIAKAKKKISDRGAPRLARA